MRAFRVAGKVIGWIVLSALLVVLSLLLTVVIVGRTQWGQRKILTVALPALQQQLGGRLKIGGISGDLTRGLTLYDVELDDVERQPAVRVKKLTAHYDLIGLGRRTIELTEVRAEGAWVHARVMRDGRLNLAALVKPSEVGKSPSRWVVRIGKVIADVEARYDQPGRSVHGTARVEGRATIDGGRVDAALEALEVRTSAPLRASLSGKGGATIDGGAIAAHGLTLTVAADGRELRKLVPEAKLRGRWRVDVRANGPAERLALSVVARPPAGRVALDATVATAAPGMAWKATVDARGLDPAAALEGVPHGDVRVEASGRGQGARGTIELKALVAEVAGTKVNAHGTLDTAGDARIWATVASHDLSRLRALGVRGLAGSVDARARVERTRTHLHVDADATAAGLALRGERVGRLELHVHSEDLIGEAHVRAGDVHASGLVLDTLALDASGEPKRVQAMLQAHGPDQTALELALDGTPTLVRHPGTTGKKIVGADLTVTKLAIARHGQAWAATEPATLRVHHGAALQGLALSSGTQTLRLDGSYDARSGALSARLHAEKLNLVRLVAMVKPSADLPDTELLVDAHAEGTLARPRVEVTLDGFSERSQELGLNRIHYDLHARWADDRAKAEWTLRSIDQSFHGKVDLPTVLTGNRPIMADIAASNIWMVKLRRVLPPALANLDGRLDASVKAWGTTARPVLAVSVHGRDWQLGPDARNNDVRLRVDYKERALDVHAEAHLEQSLGKDAGALAAEVHVPIDLSPARLRQSRRLVAELEHTTELAANATLKRLDVARFPFQQLGLTPPATAGLIDGSLTLRGTLQAPSLAVELDGHGLARGKVDKIELAASLGYAGRRATVKLDGSLRGAPLVRVRGAAPLDLARVLDRQPYLTTPLEVDVEVPGFNLARIQDLVPQLEGKLDARAAVRGTLGQPTGTAELGIAGLKLGAMRYDRFAAHAAYDGAQATATLDAHELKGGAITGKATVPLDAQQPMTASLRANGLVLDLESFGLTNPRLVKGTVNAQLDVRGPRAAPAIEGFLKLDDGKIALATDPRIYDGIKLDVTMKDGVVTLRDLEAKVQDGGVKAYGQAKLAGLKPQTLELHAEAHRFPIPTGTVGAWLDATVSVHGHAAPGGLSGTIVVERGTANLQKLTGRKKLQSTGKLEDVTFVDTGARRAAAQRAAAKESPAKLELVAKIPGPFHVRSQELSTDLAGNLQIAVAGPVARLSGQVHTQGGWLELLGRRYEIEKAHVAFGGEDEPNPALDVRLTRELSQTRLIIEVHGTARKPKLQLSSDPPIYDQSQVIAAILSGDPATQRVDDRSLDQKVTGAVSSLLVGKIKDQIAPHLPIDVIKVDTGTEGATGFGDTRVEFGKYVTDSIYVSYVHQFGSTFVGTQRVNANEVQLEWRFLGRYALETAFGDAAVGRVNLFWTVRF